MTWRIGNIYCENVRKKYNINTRDRQKISALFILKLYFVDDYKIKIHHFST
jgi:hypothetical protein